MQVQLRNPRADSCVFDFLPPQAWRRQGGEFLISHETGEQGAFAKVFVKRYPATSPAPAAGLLHSMIERPVPHTPAVLGHATDEQFEYFFFERIEGAKTLEDLLADSRDSNHHRFLQDVVFAPAFLRRLMDACADCLAEIEARGWIYTDFCAKNIMVTKQQVLLIDVDSALPSSAVVRGRQFGDRFNISFWGLWLELALPGSLVPTQLACFGSVIGRALALVKSSNADEQALIEASRLLRNPSFRSLQRPLWDGLAANSRQQVLTFWRLPESNSEAHQVFEVWNDLYALFHSGSASVQDAKRANIILLKSVTRLELETPAVPAAPVVEPHKPRRLMLLFWLAFTATVIILFYVYSCSRSPVP